jgi:hypothetical protein
MSSFTAACRDQARSAWGAAASFPDKYSAWKKGPSVGDRAQRGCLGFLIFGIGYVLVPFVIFLFVEVAVIGYALFVSALWGTGALVDSAGKRKPPAT